MSSEVAEMPVESIDLSKLDAVLERHPEPGALIPILQETQDAYGYLPPPTLQRIAYHLQLPVSAVFGVATFYAQFYLKPKGRNIIRVCKGTACHVGGAELISDAVCENLGVPDGETTTDRKFTVQSVACIGCCSLAPVLMINDDVYGRLNKDKVPDILKRY